MRLRAWVDMSTPVRPQEADELARLDVEVDSAESLYAAVALDESADGEGSGHPPEATRRP